MFDRFEDFIIFGTLCVVLIILLQCGRSVWIKFDTAVLFLYGFVCLLVPYELLDVQTEGKLDDVHLHLYRLFGAFQICSTALWWYTKESRDGTVHLSTITGRIFSTALQFIAQLYIQFWASAKSSNTKFSDIHIWVTMGTGFFLLGHLYFILRNEDYNTYPQFNIRLNTHLRIDGILMISLYLGLFAFPNIFVYTVRPSLKPDIIHLHLVRVLATYGVGSGFLSLLSPGFLHEKDKFAQLKCRLLWYAPMLAVVTYDWLINSMYPLKPLLFAGCAADTLLIANVVVCHFTDVTTIYKVERKKEK